MQEYFYAKERGNFINYINLTTMPVRLRDTVYPKDSLIYSAEEIDKIKTMHNNLEVIGNARPIEKKHNYR